MDRSHVIRSARRSHGRAPPQSGSKHVKDAALLPDPQVVVDIIPPLPTFERVLVWVGAGQTLKSTRTGQVGWGLLCFQPPGLPGGGEYQQFPPGGESYGTFQGLGPPPPPTPTLIQSIFESVGYGTFQALLPPTPPTVKFEFRVSIADSSAANSQV